LATAPPNIAVLSPIHRALNTDSSEDRPQIRASFAHPPLPMSITATAHTLPLITNHQSAGCRRWTTYRLHTAMCQICTIQMCPN